MVHVCVRLTRTATEKKKGTRRLGNTATGRVHADKQASKQPPSLSGHILITPASARGALAAGEEEGRAVRWRSGATRWVRWGGVGERGRGGQWAAGTTKRRVLEVKGAAGKTTGCTERSNVGRGAAEEKVEIRGSLAGQLLLRQREVRELALSEPNEDERCNQRKKKKGCTQFMGAQHVKSGHVRGEEKREMSEGGVRWGRVRAS